MLQWLWWFIKIVCNIYVFSIDWIKVFDGWGNRRSLEGIWYQCLISLKEKETIIELANMKEGMYHHIIKQQGSIYRPTGQSHSCLST